MSRETSVTDATAPIALFIDGEDDSSVLTKAVCVYNHCEEW